MNKAPSTSTLPRFLLTLATAALLGITALFGASTAAHAQSQVPASASEITPILIGQRAPDAELLDLDGNVHTSTSVLLGKPTVVVVLSSGWCIDCNRRLAQIGKTLNGFEELGWDVVAISPDSPEELRDATAGQALKYQLYSDVSGNFASKMGLAYDNGGDEGLQRVPGVFLMHQSGVVVYEYINVDNSVKLSGLVLLSAAKVYSGGNKRGA